MSLSSMVLGARVEQTAETEGVGDQRNLKLTSDATKFTVIVYRGDLKSQLKILKSTSKIASM